MRLSSDFLPRIMVIWIGTLLFSAPTRAQTPELLPYGRRTRAYNGWSSFARGDFRTIGLAGSTVGLADTFIAAVDNPAGLAMTTQGVGIQVSTNQIQDGNTQQYEAPIKSNLIGASAGIYPWGFSLGWWTPHQEGQEYRLSPTSSPVRLETLVREFQVSAARVFGGNRWSLGAALVFGQAERSVGENSTSDFSFGANFGLMYRFDSRWLLGISYGTPMEYAGEPSLHLSGGPADFVQPVRSPARMAVGTGWIPNRFFRLGAGLYFLGTTENTALLADETKTVGERISMQPRIGTDYILAEFREFKARAGLGTYFEFSRTAGQSGRLHLTGGLEVGIWIFGLGFAIDKAAHYTNDIYSAGVDVITLMRKLDLIPREYAPPRVGLFPHPLHRSDEGLPRALVKNWKPLPPQPDIIDIGLGIPRKLEHKIEEARDELMDAVKGPPKEYDEPMQDVAPAPAPKAASQPSRPKVKPSPSPKPASRSKTPAKRKSRSAPKR